MFIKLIYGILSDYIQNKNFETKDKNNYNKINKKKYL